MTEIDTVVTAMNFNSTNSTSTTSDTIALGSTTITVQASKSYVAGMSVKIAYTTTATNWMLGTVTAYNSGTGSLTVFIDTINGSGTWAVWTVSLSNPVQPYIPGTAKTIVHTGAGQGSSNTRVQRFTTVVTDTLGSYTDSPTLGGKFTIPASGIYSLSLSTSDSGGISKNSTEGTVGFPSLVNTGDRVAWTKSAGCALVTYLAAGDVLWVHNGAAYATVTAADRFTLERLF
jgi:hypothetical protein